MKRFSTDVLKKEEIPALLSLQKENLINNISATQAAAQGFLTFQYSEESVAEMLTDMQQPIARGGDEIVGYALATSCKVGEKMVLLQPLLKLARSLNFKGSSLSQQKFYLLGQVCVKEGWRGVGVFDSLYEKHRELFSNEYDCVVTEIAVANHRSLAAHLRVGFTVLHQYTDNNRDWHVVAWDLK